MSCSFAFLVFNFNCCEAATWLDPGLKWRTLETPNFSIHFHDGLEDTAKRLAPIAEEVHAKLVPILKHEPGLKTNVVLLDTTDYGNGSATVIPDPRIMIYTTDWSSNLNPARHDLWIRFVFLHEYVHILHLDIVEGLATPLSWIFGRAIFPNGMEPWFIVEGLATYMETKYGPGGRGDDPRWDMMMRMDVLEDNVKSIDQASVNTVRWPLGHTCYIYGVEFLEYLAETYGEEKLVSLAHIYGDFLLSYGIDGAFYTLYGKSLNMLWYEWLEYSIRKYGKVRDGLGKVTEPRLVTRSGYYNLKPKWSSDSRYVYYQQRNADAYPCLRRVEPDTGRDERLVEAWVTDNNLALDPAGKVLFTKLHTYGNYYTYSDLCLFDPKTNAAAQLTSGWRVTDADVSPDGRSIVYVKNEQGAKNLWLMDSEAVGSRLLCSYEADAQYFSPRFSPDGRRIVAAKRQRGGRQKVRLIDLEGGWQEELTFDQGEALEANPSFSSGGDYVFFDSDRSGIVNLYAFHLASGRLYQVTNVLGGAMMPDASPDGQKLAYVSYSSKGYDIAVMDIEPQEWAEVRSSVTKPVSLSGYETRTKDVERASIRASDAVAEYTDIHDYDPIPTLRPKFWLPVDYSSETGTHTALFTGGTDILGRHRYQISYGYDWESEKSDYSLLYVNNQFLPQIAVQFMENAVPYDWNGATLWMRHTYGLAAATLFESSLVNDWDRLALLVGYEQTGIAGAGDISGVSPQPSLGRVNGVLLALRYASTRSYAKSISPEDGLDATLQVSLNSDRLGSDYTYTNYSLNAASYFALGSKNQVLAETLYGFYSKGDQLEQSNFSWRYLPIRGYPTTDLLGNKGVLLASEYRFPIWYAEKAFLMYGYTFFDRLWGSLFFDLGGATFASASDLTLKRGYGLELNLEMMLFWYLSVDFKLGYAKGLDEGGEEKVYFSVGGML